MAVANKVYDIKASLNIDIDYDFWIANSSFEQNVRDGNIQELSSEQILHDIKTPLSIMYNNIRSLERGAGSYPEFQEPLEALKKNWLRILKLLTDAEDYQKLCRGLIAPNLLNQDIVALVKDITNSIRPLTERKKINLSFEYDFSKKIMAIDKDILDRILLNLLSNAVKFTEEAGHIKVLLSESGKFVILTVQDNGIGISQENLSKVFQPRFFERNKYNKNGTGIGLYVVKELVTLLGGDIKLDKLSAGTSVSVSLPCLILESAPESYKFYDDFYSDNMIQVELSDDYY